VDRWIYSRLNGAARTLSAAFEGYRFNDAAITAYEYFWNDFCDWYVEATKLSIRAGDDAEKDRATTVLLDVLSESLKLLHPLIPFVTEEIYAKLPAECKRSGNVELPLERKRKGNVELLITARYPAWDPERDDPEGEGRFAFLQDLVRRIRTCRSECTVTPDKQLRASVTVGGGGGNGGEAALRAAFLKENAALVKLLAGLGELAVQSGGEAAGAGTAGGANGGAAHPVPAGAVVLAGADFQALLFIGEAVDLAALKAKFEKNLSKDKQFIRGLEAKIANPDFVKNAPAELVEGEKQKLAEARERTGKIESYLRGLA
jgi:valyl-tRNA synthetase